VKTSSRLIVGNIYSRKALQELFDIRDANLRNGVFKPSGHESVWLFVTEQKPPDRTPYTDYLDGDLLNWDGQTRGRTDRLVIEHRQRGLEILLFYRRRREEHLDYGFRYEGIFEYFLHTGTQPTHFLLQRVGSDNVAQAIIQTDLAATFEEEERFEGERKQRLTNYYERDPHLRAEAVAYHGTKCMVCDFDFEAVYGSHGAGYIEVHHLRPVSSLLFPTYVDYKTEMAVVCANCHRILHRDRGRLLSIDELRALIQR
jgi:5-methylcytosine-specific restriction enzyme A